jgi:hypothetical protein
MRGVSVSFGGRERTLTIIKHDGSGRRTPCVYTNHRFVNRNLRAYRSSRSDLAPVLVARRARSSEVRTCTTGNAASHHESTAGRRSHNDTAGSRQLGLGRCAHILRSSPAYPQRCRAGRAFRTQNVALTQEAQHHNRVQPYQRSSVLCIGAFYSSRISGCFSCSVG